MNKTGCFFFAVALVVGSLSPCAQEAEAESEGPSATAQVDFNSAYTWRGLAYSDGWVAQPSIDLSGMTLGGIPVSVNVWSNFNFTDFDGTVKKNQFSEVDLTLTAELGAGFSLGFTQYALTSGATTDPEEESPGTGEFSLAWSKEWVITPEITLFYDVEEVDGAFLQCAFSHSFALGEKASLDLTGEFGVASDAFVQYYSGVEEGGFHQVNATVKYTYQPTDHFGFTAMVGYMDHLDVDVLPDQPVEFYGGFGLAYTF